MHRVRYYSQLVEPSYFKGVRGWWIRVLNRVRFWLETRISKHVLKYLANEDGQTPFRVKELLKEFHKDVREETAKFDMPAMGSVTTLDSIEPASIVSKVGSRRTTESVLARLLAGPRAKRYTKDRQGHHFGDLDGDFEATAPEMSETPTVEVSYARNEFRKQQ